MTVLRSVRNVSGPGATAVAVANTTELRKCAMNGLYGRRHRIRAFLPTLWARGGVPLTTTSNRVTPMGRADSLG